MNICSIYTMFCCFSLAQHRYEWRGSAGSAALLRGTSQRLGCVPVGERTLHVPVAGTGVATRPRPEPLQPAIPRPPASAHGQSLSAACLALLLRPTGTWQKVAQKTKSPLFWCFYSSQVCLNWIIHCPTKSDPSSATCWRRGQTLWR